MKHIKKVSALLMCALIALSACLTASAATNPAIKNPGEKGSITITVYNTDTDDIGTDKGYGYNDFVNSDDYDGVKDLEFGLYNEAGTDKVSGVANVKTGSDGKAKFSNLAPGTYTVKVESYPGTVKGVIANFKVTTPITNKTGDGLLYDVYAYPKLQAIYGDVTLTKTDADDNPLPGAVFKLEKKNSGDTWSTVEGKGSLTTDAQGKIPVKDLPYGEYQFVETKAPDGYNLDERPIKFKIDRTTSNGGIYNIGNDGSTYTVTLSMKNYLSSGIKKELVTGATNLKEVNGSYYLNLNNNKDNNIITWNITTTVPGDFDNKYTAFYIEDTLDEAFKYDSATITVGGTTNVSLTPEITGNTVKFDFANNSTAAATLKTNQGKEIKIVFKARLVKPNITSAGSSNTAKLHYKTNTGTEETPEAPADKPVLVGGVSLKKTGEKGVNLPGAEFKLYATEADAKAGTNELSFYTTYRNESSAYTTFDGWKDVATSNENGEFGFYGLPAGTYYMVETKAPEKYELLKEVREITIGLADGNSYTTSLTIENLKKAIELPFTGGVGAEVVVASGVLMMVAAGFVLKKRVK